MDLPTRTTAASPIPVAMALLLAGGLLATGPLGAGAAHAGPGQQDKSQRKCLTLLAKAGMKVSKAQSKVISNCLKEAGKGVFPGGDGVQACMGGDPKGDVAEASQKTINQQSTRCSTRPGFGYTDAYSVNSMALNALVGAALELLGSDLDEGVATVRDANRCQRKLFRKTAKALDAAWKDYIGCTKRGLRNGSVTSRSELGECVDSFKSAGSKTSRAMARLSAEIAKSCAVLDLAATLPGACSGAGAATGTCLVDRAYCQACRMLSDAADLAIDCDLIDDAADNSSCPDHPVVFENMSKLAVTGITRYVIPAEACAADGNDGLAPDCSAGGTSGPWATLTPVVAAPLRAGDALEMGAGTYSLVKQTASQPASGTPTQPVRVSSYLDQVVVLDGGWSDVESPGDTTPVLRVGSAYQHWKGLTIDGCNMVCVQVKEGSDHLLFEGNTVNGGGEDGVKATLSRLALYRDNEFTDFYNEAIDVWHTRHAWFIANEFHHNNTSIPSLSPSEAMWTKAGSENIHIIGNSFHDLDLHTRALQLGGCCWANWEDRGGLLCEGGVLSCDATGDCCDCLGGQWVPQPVARQIYALGNLFDAVTLGNPSPSAQQGVLGASGCYDCEAAYNVVTDSDDAFSVAPTQGIDNQPCCGSLNCNDPETGLCNRPDECSYADYPQNLNFHDNIAAAIRQSAGGMSGGSSARLWNTHFGVPTGSSDLRIDSNTYCVDQPVTCRIGGLAATPITFTDWQSQGWDTTSTLVDEASCPPLP
ncbi:MAG: right-handed parallel beta-helix repeat-containing protein [Candidatus Binatia bacterium]